MSDFYCDEALSGKTPVSKVHETDSVLAFHHTKPHWPVHIVVVPKQHIASLLTITDNEHPLFLELLKVVQLVAAQVTKEHGACRVLTNLGEYQDSKHLHFHICHGEPLQ